MRPGLGRLIRPADHTARGLLVAACLLVGAVVAVRPAAAATPLGTTISFTGQASATEVVDGLTVFSTHMTWRETADYGARDDLVPEGFHVAFTTVAGTGTVSILQPPAYPSADPLPVCAGAVVAPVPITERFSPVNVTSPRKPASVVVSQGGIGRVRAYDSIGVTVYLPSGETDDLSGQPSPGSVQPFEFCDQMSPIPPWPVYAQFTTRAGVYRYAHAFVAQTGECPSPTDPGTHFTTAWTGHLSVQFGRRVVGRLELPIGRTTLLEPPPGRIVPEIGSYDPLGGVYQPKAGAVNQPTCL